MIKKILLGVAAIVVVFLLVVAMQPAEFRITRSSTISGDASDVFAQIDDFHNWKNWSPWEKMDPEMKRTFEGETSGVGAIYSWEGNKKVGSGKMTIVESRPDELVRIKLEFFKPFAATNDTEFSLKDVENGTSVTWTMSGRNGFLGKAMCLFKNMDKMVGPDFENGLAQMKSTVETARQDAQQNSADTE